MRFQRFLEAVNTRDDRLHRRIIDDGDLALVVQHLRHQLACFLAALVVVGAYVRQHFNALGGNVHGDDLDARILRLLDGRQHALAIDRRDDQHIDALDDHVFNISQLLAQILVGNGDFERHILRLRLGLHRVRQFNIKRVLLRQKRCTDAVRPGSARRAGEQGCGSQRFQFQSFHDVAFCVDFEECA